MQRWRQRHGSSVGELHADGDLEALILTGTADINGTGNGARQHDHRQRRQRTSSTATPVRTVLVGGEGDDTYVVDNAGDVVVENAGEGTDTVRAAISHALGANVENLVLTGVSDIDATGNGLANVLTGNAGNNVLDGGAGADQMSGGLGNDTYVVDDAGDAVIENANGGQPTRSARRSASCWVGMSRT